MLDLGLVNKTKPSPLLIAFIKVFSHRTISTKADVWLPGKERSPAGTWAQIMRQEWRERRGYWNLIAFDLQGSHFVDYVSDVV